MSITLDWSKYVETAVKTVSEGIILLKNDNQALPLNKNDRVSVWGRIQLHYYKSGTGSGGMVNVSKVIGVTDGLIDAGVNIDDELYNVYKEWDSNHPFDHGAGWGTEPWSQEEMAVSDDLVNRISEKSDTAIIIIGRTAGEEQDNTLSAGTYYLSQTEKDMIAKVRSKFNRVIMLLNTGGIMDMSFLDDKALCPDALMLIWQGGMIGGTGTARVLIGEASPSGKLTDTISYSVTDNPADKNFGNPYKAVYEEDIYVGYRYFETFAKEKVRYPFGFGLSYAEFDISCISACMNNNMINIKADVINLSKKFSGKEVVQLYCEAPQGKLGKPLRSLCGFKKTGIINPDETERIELHVNIDDLASYDDNGSTGNKDCFVLEKGEYKLYMGSDVRKACAVFSFVIDETMVISHHDEALAPVIAFKRLKPIENSGVIMESYEDVPLSSIDEQKRIADNLPAEIDFTGDKGIKLYDVKTGKNTIEEFVAQLSDRDLSCIIRGEGMGSPKVTAGTAAAFGGVSNELSDYGIPCGCCSDGPSGMRLDCGTKAFSMPNGTLIASTFNPELITELFELAGLEIAANNVECLLGPGMNIHRHPLNGRNFEYFSEDPMLTGIMASAELKGLHSANVTGTIKHFCGNNQELGRHTVDTIVSERALREIYLKGFEIAVKQGKARSIMTTYGRVNGLWTAGNYDLNTTILRKDWGYQGFTMTDWWANINRRDCEPDNTDFAAMARAQNDVYMVCADGSNHNDNVLSELSNGGITRGELQRNAMNICRFLMDTRAIERLCGCEEKIDIINRDDNNEGEINENVECFKLDREVVIPLDKISAEKGSSFVFVLEVNDFGQYDVYMTASSESGELAQIPVSLIATGFVCGTFTWNGTGGEYVELKRDIKLYTRYTTVRLFFAQSGLKLKDIRFKLDKPF